MHNVSVTYFDAKAVAEGIRLLLAYGDQEFKDIRVSFEEWPELKPKTPFGGLPILEIDGKKYATCLAICRYLGNKYGLIGDNDEEAFEIDQNVDYIYDIRLRAALIHWEQDQELKEKKFAEFSKVFPEMMDKLQVLLEKNNGYVAAGKLTWGDFHLAGMHDYLKIILRMPDLDERYPILKQITDRVYSIPKVKAFADKSPPADW